MIENAWTYILLCADGTYYVGSTIDLQSRVTAHEVGMGAAYTRTRLPVKVVWHHQVTSIQDAYTLEKRIQGWSHAKREAFIEGGFATIKGWSRTHG